jgi:hypothetical protein
MQIDDRRAHFLTMLGDVCTAAGLASISVEILLTDGSRMAGTPSPQPSAGTSARMGETGYAQRLFIDGSSAQMEEVVEFVVRSP